jgi:hypothetical protein
MTNLVPPTKTTTKPAESRWQRLLRWLAARANTVLWFQPHNKET